MPDNPNTNLSIVILNWNAADDTVGCVNNILAWTRLTPAVFVVDNASQDDSVAVIERECPTIHLICNSVNTGFTGGTNTGIAQALALHIAPVLLLNNDAYIDESSVIELMKALEADDTLGFVGPLMFDAEKPERLISAGGKNPIKHHQTRLAAPRSTQTVYPVDNVSGTAVLIKVDVFETVGLLDEDFFFSTELADFCMRAKQYGYFSAIVPTAKASHTVSRSSSRRDTLYVYYIIRNRFIIIRNSPYTLKFLWLLFWGLYSLTLSLKLRFGGNLATAKAVQMGLSDGLQKRFGGQNERVMAACTPLIEPK